MVPSPKAIFTGSCDLKGVTDGFIGPIETSRDGLPASTTTAQTPALVLAQRSAR